MAVASNLKLVALLSLVSFTGGSALLTACGDGTERDFGKDGKGGPAGAAAKPSGDFATGEPGSTNAPAVCAPAKGNFDVPGNGCDDDADGNVDNAVPCDGALPVAGDAATFVKALGLCKVAAVDSWGLVSATYTRGPNTGPPGDGQHGILKKFGDVVKPREGVSLGVLSTGFAREFDKGDGPGKWDPLKFFPGLSSDAFKGGQQMSNQPGALPPGYPKAAADCTIANDVHDVASIDMEIKVPSNARGLKFDFNFYSGEWPEYVCTRFNDGFAAFLKSTAFNGGALDNISFDAKSNPVSVNNGFFDRCTPNAQTGCAGGAIKTAACPGGEAELAGTGFAQKGSYCGGTESTAGGATGWLTSQAPVQPGETISLHLVIWDTGDSSFDSSVLLDNLSWQEGPTETKTERPK